MPEDYDAVLNAPKGALDWIILAGKVAGIGLWILAIASLLTWVRGAGEIAQAIVIGAGVIAMGLGYGLKRKHS